MTYDRGPSVTTNQFYQNRGPSVTTNKFYQNHSLEVYKSHRYHQMSGVLKDKEELFEKLREKQPHIAAMEIEDPERFEKVKRAFEAVHNFMKAYVEDKESQGHK